MDRKDFEIRFRTYYLPLCMYALRLTGNTESAQDAVQDVFGNVWEKISSGNEIDNLKSYLYRAVHNRAFNRPSGEVAMDESELYDVPEEEVDTSERDARLWLEIGKLPDRMRLVFLMSKRDGMTYKEIAEDLGLSEKTVEHQISKALHRLRDSLAPEGRKVFFLPFL